MVGLTTEGEAVIEQAIAKALRITEQTLAPLEAEERVAFLRLLEKIC
jgi:DNA-binding MarR family transcriptional regulator